jgi:adenosylmethionine-8-amino-7-oxononanoate aminotransferase
MGARLHDGLRATFGDHPHVGDIRGGKGLLAALEIVEDRSTKAFFPAERKVGARVQAEMVKRGLITRVKGNEMIFYAPPLVVTAAEIDRVVSITAESMKAVLGR